MKSELPIGHEKLVLAVHPTARGFGWVIFEGPSAPLDWSVASAKQGRTARLTGRFERIVNRYEPSMLVIGEFGSDDRRAEGARRLHQDMTHLALLNGLDVVSYPPHIVTRYFSHVGATTKHEIAEYIASKIKGLSHRVPRKRRIYDGEQHTQALFDAAALAMTHFAANHSL